MSNTEIKIQYLDESEPDALYLKYPTQQEPQDCYLEIDCAEGTVRCDWDGEIGGGVPSSVFHLRVLRFSLPCLHARAANELLRDPRVLTLIQRILDGYTGDWDNNCNCIGKYTGVSVKARMDLEILTSDYGDPEIDCVIAWDAGDWLDPIGLRWPEDKAVALKITGQTTDEQLEEIQEEIEVEASCDGVHRITGLDDYLTDLRDDLRDLDED